MNSGHTNLNSHGTLFTPLQETVEQNIRVLRVTFFKFSGVWTKRHSYLVGSGRDTLFY